MLSEHVRDSFVILTEVHIEVFYRIDLMIGPDPPTQFILYMFYGVHDWGKAGQGKTLTLFCALFCVVIYTLYEALQCHARKCQVRYFV